MKSSKGETIKHHMNRGHHNDIINIIFGFNLLLLTGQSLLKLTPGE